VLRAMRRPGDQEKTLERIKAWRKACPDLTLRSTFILGFPGETEEDFEFLLAWLEEARLDRVGAFQYEPVGGAVANDLGLPAVPPEVRESRYRRFMRHQQAISAGLLKNKVGRHAQVIIDRAGTHEAEGRTKGDAPEIDGKVKVASRRPLRAGDIVSVKIERSDSYDLFGTTA
jgi:ribosomal protein S12 methylthiotransferase